MSCFSVRSVTHLKHLGSVDRRNHWFARYDPTLMNFNSDPAPQQFDSKYQMSAALKSLQHALYSAKRSLFNSDFATDAEMVPRLHVAPPIDRQTYHLNLNRIHTDR